MLPHSNLVCKTDNLLCGFKPKQLNISQKCLLISSVDDQFSGKKKADLTQEIHLQCKNVCVFMPFVIGSKAPCMQKALLVQLINFLVFVFTVQDFFQT